MANSDGVKRRPLELFWRVYQARRFVQRPLQEQVLRNGQMASTRRRPPIRKDSLEYRLGMLCAMSEHAYLTPRRPKRLTQSTSQGK